MFYTTRPTLGHRQMTSSHVYYRGKAPKDLFIPDFLRSASQIERGFQKGGDGGPRTWTHEHGTATNRHCAEIRIVSQRFGSQSMTSFVFSIRWTIGCHLCIYRFFGATYNEILVTCIRTHLIGRCFGPNTTMGPKHTKNIHKTNQSLDGYAFSIPLSRAPLRYKIRPFQYSLGSLASSIQYHTQMLS